MEGEDLCGSLKKMEGEDTVATLDGSTRQNHKSISACSVGWWLMAGAGLF
jgi:hypothetical protein